MTTRVVLSSGQQVVCVPRATLEWAFPAFASAAATVPAAAALLNMWLAALAPAAEHPSAERAARVQELAALFEQARGGNTNST